MSPELIKEFREALDKKIVNDRMEPMFKALQLGDEKRVLKLLKDDKGLAHCCDTDGRGAFWVAARLGLVGAMRKLRQMNPQAELMAPNWGCSSLVAAALSGSVEAVTMMLEEPASASAMKEAIEAAALDGRRETMLVLLAAASPEVIEVAAWGAEGTGLPCVERCVGAGHADCALALAQWAGPQAALAAREKARRALTAAAEAGQGAAARGLARLSDVNQADAAGWTPLALAALSGSSETVAALLEEGADVNATAPSGKTALMLALENGGPGQLRCAGALAQDERADLSIQARFNIFGPQMLDASGLARALGRMEMLALIEKAQSERPLGEAAAERSLALRAQAARGAFLREDPPLRAPRKRP